MCHGTWGWAGPWAGGQRQATGARTPEAEALGALGVLVPAAVGIVLILTVVPQLTWVIFAAGWMLFPVVGQFVSAVSRLGSDAAWRPRPAPAATTGTPAREDAADVDGAGILRDIERDVARLWMVARAMPVSTARDQALRICAAAERVLATMATSEQTVTATRWFRDHRLRPTLALFERYARLAGRGVSTASADILGRVERHDLPLLERAFDAYAERLVRGDAVDLAVASELLEIELDQEPPKT